MCNALDHIGKKQEVKQILTCPEIKAISVKWIGIFSRV